MDDKVQTIALRCTRKKITSFPNFTGLIKRHFGFELKFGF